MIQCGTFVHDTIYNNLYIASDHKTLHKVCDNNLILVPNEHQIVLYNHISDIIASQSMIDAFKNNREWPDWVKKILNTKNNSTSSMFSIDPVEYNNFKKGNQEVTLQSFQASCPHKWKIYNGFSRVYEYCELCDSKRDY